MKEFELVKELGQHVQREFSCQEIFKVIKSQPVIMWSWGLSKTVLVRGEHEGHRYEGGLLFKVNGRVRKGFILLTLGWSDTFELRHVNKNGKVLSHETDIYIDELVRRMDYFIETPVEV